MSLCVCVRVKMQVAMALCRTPLLHRVLALETLVPPLMHTAGDEYKIRMCGSGETHVGAIIQIDGVPAEKDFNKSPFTYFKKPYDDPGWCPSLSADLARSIYALSNGVAQEDVTCTLAAG